MCVTDAIKKQEEYNLNWQEAAMSFERHTVLYIHVDARQPYTDAVSLSMCFSLRPNWPFSSVKMCKTFKFFGVIAVSSRLRPTSFVSLEVFDLFL